MYDGEPQDHGFVSPWFTIPENQPVDSDYFPNDYPVADALVTPASKTEDEAQA